MIARAFIYKFFFLLLGISLMSLGCRNNASGQYKYTIPEPLEDGISVKNIHEVELDTSLIFKAINKIKAGKFDEVHSFLIYRDHNLVLEEYFEGHKYQWDAPKHYGALVQWDRDMLHSIMSDTKSVTSTLIGIAIDQGFIESEKQSIFDYLPDHQHLKTNGKEEITIEHLLTMTSGLEWYEWGAPYSSPDNPIIGIWYSDKDPVSFILEGALVHKPGTHYSYYGGCQILLGEIIKNATQMDINAFSKTYLFEPLGIEDYDWSVRFENGVYESAGGLKLSPRAMLKFGILFLNRGTWKGKQIISDSWIKKSATPYGGNLDIKVPGERSWRHGYTYGWWTKSWDEPTVTTFFAGGWGGQNIMIIPKQNMVVVFTGGNYTAKPHPKKIMDKYIIPALQ